MIPIDIAWDWAKVLIFAALSCIGGALGYVMRSLDAGHALTWWQTALEGLSAAFFGVMIGMICMEFDVSIAKTFMVVGVSAWIGARATVKVLKPTILRMILFAVRREENNNDKPSN